MAGVELIDPQALYNILQDFDFHKFYRTGNFILLLDARIRQEYDESHVVTAIFAPRIKDGNFEVPFGADLPCKEHVIVYDSTTSKLEESNTNALACAQILSDGGSRNPVKIVKGGFETFSALYPFLRSDKIFYLPKEVELIKLYPAEILSPLLLYFGKREHVEDAQTLKDLHIRAIVNCSSEIKTDPIMEDTRVSLNGVLNVSLSGNDEETLSTVTLREICSFIEERVQRREAVLICSTFGTNRSAAVALAFLIHHNDISLRDAYRLLRECVRRIRPNRRYLEDLLAFEQSVHGVRTSAADIDMLAF